jgi:hypothetical protein
LKLHALSKITGEVEGFANTEVDNVINEIDVFGTDITMDVEKRAKEAKYEFDKSLESFAEKEELEAAQVAKDAEVKAAREAEVAAAEADDAAKNAFKDVAEI